MSTGDARDDTPQMARMPWYPRDFASATRGWPLVARGIYRELLDAQWDLGGLPNDAEVLRGIAGASPAEWRRGWPVVRSKFRVGPDGRLRNARLEQHRETALNLRKRAKSGAKGRWGHLRPVDGGNHAR